MSELSEHEDLKRENEFLIEQLRLAALTASERLQDQIDKLESDYDADIVDDYPSQLSINVDHESDPEVLRKELRRVDRHLREMHRIHDLDGWNTLWFGHRLADQRDQVRARLSRFEELLKVARQWVRGEVLGASLQVAVDKLADEDEEGPHEKYLREIDPLLEVLHDWYQENRWYLSEYEPDSQDVRLIVAYARWSGEPLPAMEDLA